MKIATIRKDLSLKFGDRHDGVIGIPGLTHDGQVIEMTCFYGQSRPKHIIVISSQAGCPLHCAFCELGPERFVRNLTAEEIRDQAELLLATATNDGINFVDQPYKVTVANSGEPLLNRELTAGLNLLGQGPSSFKVSTVYPATAVAKENLRRLARFAAELDRPVQLQISLISTSETRRSNISGGHVAGFHAIREAGDLWRTANPKGRKVNLSLIITSDMPCRAGDVVTAFPPELFRFRFREYVPTRNGQTSGLSTISPERLTEIKDDFGAHGYEVGDWASPSPIERQFNLAANVIRRTYLDMTGETSPKRHLV